MASKLWTRPYSRTPTYSTKYTDLFHDVSPKMQMEFIKWDQKLHSFEWPHRFLQYRNEPIKSEWTAIDFGNIGNEYFERCEWRKAMEMYNQAMRFVEIDSNNLGVLMAKRGFCFSNMKMYDAGNVDIDYALTLKLSPDWVEGRRVNKFVEDCIKPHVAEVPKLSFACDDVYTAMANVVELKSNANRTYIVAKQDIDVGRCVLLEESFVSIANNFDKTCCSTCLNEIQNFLPCRSCTDAVFCSPNCLQRNHLHQLTCGQKFHRMPTPVRFVIQSILQAILICPTIDFLMQFVQVHNASPNAAAAAAMFTVPLDASLRNYSLFLKQKIQNALSMATAYQAYKTLMSMDFIAKYCNTQSKQRFLMHLVGHHTMVLECNAFGGFETNQNQFISGKMANLVATIEHSCAPNILHFAYGHREVCITIRPIRAGERLCYDYRFDDNNNIGNGKSGESTEQRKEQLWEYWRIDCKCLKCCMHDQIMTNPQIASDPAFFFVSTYKRHSDTNRSTLERLKQKCMHFLRKFKDEPWTNEMEIISKVYSQCILDEYNRNYGPFSN